MKPTSITESPNKNIAQTYIFTMSRFNWTLVEKRIIYRIIEFNQDMLAGKTLMRDYSFQDTLFSDREYRMPMRVFLKENDDKNHMEVKKAFEELTKKILSFEWADGSWELTNLVINPKFDAKTGIVTFKLHDKVYKAFLNFSKGYRRFELLTAMRFKCVYSMRFYEIFSQKADPIHYSFDVLKKTFGCENEYKQVGSFIQKVIEPAKKELDATSPYTFTYTPYKKGRKIEGWLFVPIHQPEHDDPTLERKELQKKVDARWDLPKEVYYYLKEQYGFTSDEIKRNIDVFKTMSDTNNDFVLWLATIKAKVFRVVGNPKGYLIGAMKREIKKAMSTPPPTAGISNTSFHVTFPLK
jgi:hypothetical protein